MTAGVRAKLLAVVAALITYGSLYPFNFTVPAAHAAAWQKLLFDFSLFTSRGDALGNLALFLPFGFAGAFAATRHASGAPRVVTIALASLVLASALQVAQIYFPPRTPALADVLWNMLGTALGMLAAWSLRGHLTLRQLDWKNASAVPAALIALWLAAELVPLVPSLDLQSLKNSAKALLRMHLSPFDILWHAAGVLVAGRALQAIFGTEKALRLLAVLVAVIIVGKLVIVTRVLNASTLAGCAIGYAVWRFAWAARQPVRGVSMIPLVVLAAYTLKALEPYELRAVPADFRWLPFAAMLQGAMLINTMALVESVFAFAAILGLARMAKAPVGAGSIVLALWVGVLEASQMYLVGRTPDITEPLLVLLVGWMLRHLPGGATSPATRPGNTPRRTPDTPHRPADMPRRPAVTPATSPSGPPSPTHVPGLDGLRAVACLMVFGVHFSQITRLQGSFGPFDLARFFENGNSGVALFFVLSGFLLSLPYWNAARTGIPLPPTGDYFLHRAARILPAYFACLTWLIIVNRFWLKSEWLRDVLLHYGLVFNYLDETIFRINPPFWTLAVEAQFYLLLPLIFLAVSRMRAGAGLAAVIALGAVAYLAHFLVMRSVAPMKPPAVLIYSLVAHLPHFLMGIAASWIFVFRGLQQQTIPGRSRGRRDAAFWACVAAVLLVLSTPLDAVLQIPHGRYNLPYLPVLLCAIIVLAPLSATGRRLLESWPLRGIGIVSYGIYIWHLPIQHAIARQMASFSLDPKENWLVFGIVSLGFTLIVAAVSYLVLEKPILNAVRRRRAPRMPLRRAHGHRG